MVTLFAGTIALLFIVGLVQEFIRLQHIPHLATPNDRPDKRPFVSVLIPARNEAHTIGRCLDGILEQSYPTYEVIVVDDASTDETGAILARYAQQHARLRVINSQELPPGWMGKPHACQQAANAAGGVWLLFLDADTTPQPGLVAALVAHTEQHQQDMLTVFPFLELGSFWERVVLPPFRAIMHSTFPYERLNAPDVRPEEVAANGQCIFVRQASYAAIGGHAAVRNAVLEDVHLARELRRAGFRTGAVSGLHHLRVRMYTTGREVFEGLTKNAAAGYASGGGRSLWVGMRQFFLALAPLWLVGGGLVLLLVSGDTQSRIVFGLGVAVSLLVLSFWGRVLQHLYALPGFYAVLWPFGLHCYGFIVLYSLWKVRSGRGVLWKGRNYVGT
jgi:glycosyltransferase involved in cell wall biosynthesis